MTGLSVIHLELTSYSQKDCPMCGRRQMEREFPHLCSWGNMPLDMALKISSQIMSGTVVQFHNNGEPLMYPYLGAALYFFQHCIRQFNTNAILLMEKYKEIIGNLEVLTISVIQDDKEGDAQYENVVEFLDRKGTEKPNMVYRLLGDVEKADRWEKLPGIVCRRVLHAPGGSYDYKKKVTAGYTLQLAGDALKRISLPSQPIAYASTLAAVTRDPGDEISLGATPCYRLSRKFAIVAGAAWTQRGSDKVELFKGQDSIPGAPPNSWQRTLADVAWAPPRASVVAPSDGTYLVRDKQLRRYVTLHLDAWRGWRRCPVRHIQLVRD